MKEEVVKKEVKVINKYNGGASGAVYGLGLIGALVYYLQGTSNFPDALMGIIKAILWPGFLIYKVFQVLGM